MHISLNLDLEESVFFDMDVAVPLGIIVNELVSNSFKHAFPGMEEGQIHIKLLKNKNRDSESRSSENRDSESRSSENRDSENREYMNKESKSDDNISGSDNFVLIVSDNGVGISESFDLEQSDTLGLQLITTLVGQLEGEFEVKKGRGAEFITRFTVKEKH
jgi:two-component sensor histidine kinase